jgi:transposase
MDQLGNDNDFTAGLLTHCLPYIDAVSEHYYASDGRPPANPNQAKNRAAPPRGLEVHLVMDNYGTHKVTKVRTWLTRHPRYHVHFTPTSGSWLNLVERLFAEVTERCVRRGSHTAVRELEKAMLA